MSAKRDVKGLGRLAIYYRVSTDKQDLASQKQAIEKFLEDLPQTQKPTKTLIYQDEGISGTRLDRPEFQKMLQDAASHRIDTIMVYRLDRFSRNATTAIQLLLKLDEQGVAFISVTQPMLNLGHDFPFRRMILAAFAEIAEIERETIVERVRAGLEAAKKRGVKLGAPVKMTEEKKQMISQLRQQGLGIKKIAQQTGLSVGSVHSYLKTHN